MAHDFEQDETHICTGWTFGQPKAEQNHPWCFACLASGVYRGIVAEETKLRSVNVLNLPKPIDKLQHDGSEDFQGTTSLNNCTNHSLINHCRPTVTGAKQPLHLEWYGALCVPYHSALRVGACSSGIKCGIWVTCFYRDVISLQENVWDGKECVFSGLVLGKTA